MEIGVGELEEEGQREGRERRLKIGRKKEKVMFCCFDFASTVGGEWTEDNLKQCVLVLSNQKEAGPLVTSLEGERFEVMWRLAASLPERKPVYPSKGKGQVLTENSIMCYRFSTGLVSQIVKGKAKGAS